MFFLQLLLIPTSFVGIPTQLLQRQETKLSSIFMTRRVWTAFQRSLLERDNVKPVFSH